jgi:hypothetical protein
VAQGAAVLDRVDQVIGDVSRGVATVAEIHDDVLASARCKPRAKLGNDGFVVGHSVIALRRIGSAVTRAGLGLGMTRGGPLR